MDFDLYNLLVNELAGDMKIFVILAILAVVVICLKFNIPFFVGTMMIMILCGVIYAYDPDWNILWVVPLLIVGYYLFQEIYRQIER